MLPALFILIFILGIAVIQVVMGAREINDLRKLVRDQSTELRSQLALIERIKDETGEFCSRCKCPACLAPAIWSD